MKKKGIISLELTAALALGALTGCGNTTAKETTAAQMRLLRQQKHPKQQVQVKHEWLNWD